MMVVMSLYLPIHFTAIQCSCSIIMLCMYICAGKCTYKNYYIYIVYVSVICFIIEWQRHCFLLYFILGSILMVVDCGGVIGFNAAAAATVAQCLYV